MRHDDAPAPKPEYVEGQTFSRADGAAVRIDYVHSGIVYFVAWPPGENTGSPKRMYADLFAQAIAAEGMVLDAPR